MGNYNRFSLQKGLTEVVVRLWVTITATASVLAGKAMIAAGLRRPPEGWRRTVGILLRSESTRFALSAFGLRVPEAGSAAPPGSDALQFRTARALQAFLATEPDAHFALEWLPAGHESPAHRVQWTWSCWSSGPTAGSPPSNLTWRQQVPPCSASGL